MSTTEDLIKQIEYLTEKIKILEHKEIYNKYLIAISDFVIENKIDKKLIDLGDSDYIFFKYLKEDVSHMEHYIKKNDSYNVKQYKFKHLYHKLNDIPDYISDKICQNYSNILDKLTPYFDNKNIIKLSNSTKYRIDNWWI